jgi:DNA end-binding protein Ku
LDLASFTDRYQAAVLDLIKAKVDGATPVLVPRSEVGQVINLMDALRQSVEQAAKKPEPVRKNGRKKAALAA